MEMMIEAAAESVELVWGNDLFTDERDGQAACDSYSVMNGQSNL